MTAPVRELLAAVDAAAAALGFEPAELAALVARGLRTIAAARRVAEPSPADRLRAVVPLFTLPGPDHLRGGA